MPNIIARVIKLIQQDRFTPINPNETIKVTKKILQRVHLNECVKYMNQLKGINYKLKFNADDFSVLNVMKCVDMALKQSNRHVPSLKSVRRKLFREERKLKRKSLQPRKRTGNEDLLNVRFNAKIKSSVHKIRRGYLNEASKNVEPEICARKNLFEGMKLHCMATEWKNEPMYPTQLAST